MGFVELMSQPVAALTSFGNRTKLWQQGTFHARIMVADRDSSKDIFEFDDCDECLGKV